MYARFTIFKFKANLGLKNMVGLWKRKYISPTRNLARFFDLTQLFLSASWPTVPKLFTFFTYKTALYERVPPNWMPSHT
jgi:hypothetical protein